MYSKFVLAIRFCSAKMAILVRKWPMADCYFKLWYTNTCMFCVVYSSIQKFTIITIMKTAIFITIIFVISILSNYLNYRTALVPLVYHSSNTTVSISFTPVVTEFYAMSYIWCEVQLPLLLFAMRTLLAS